MGCALLTFLYLARAVSGSSLRRYSVEAVISYQPPSWKSMTALPFQLTVTTRPTIPAKRRSSGCSAFTSTYWSVHSRFSASLSRRYVLILATLRYVLGRPEGVALRAPRRLEVE